MDKKTLTLQSQDFIPPEQSLMMSLIPALKVLLAEDSHSAFIIVPNNYERRYISCPQYLSYLYRYLTKKYPLIIHIKVVDDDVFNFLYQNKDVELITYS